MPEPTLEFIGQRLKAIQDEQRLQRMRFDLLEQRFNTVDARLGGIEERLAAIQDNTETRFADIEGKLDIILEKLER